MNATHLPRVSILAVACFVSLGCRPRQPPPPPLATLERTLGVAFPPNAVLIGGVEASTAPLWIVVSTRQLPLPVSEMPATDKPSSRTRSTRRRRRVADTDERGAGTPIPLSSLLNLISACEVNANDVPRLTGGHGVSHVGQLRNSQYTYREAATETGWITAIEIYSP